MTKEIEGVDLAEAAWCAGFLDGEGHFGISKRTTPFIEAAQVASREPLDRLQNLLKGSVRQRRDGAYIWKVDGGLRVRRAVPLVFDFLTVKREEARLLMAFAQFVRPRGCVGYPPEERLIRDALHRQLLDTRRRS